jgi:two-component system response regulator CpxR
MHISNLRKKLGQHPDGSERLKTVRGVGYVFTVVPKST